jgi:tRNA pseudouridine13 synthase
MTKELEKVYARLKTSPEDFIVEELARDWECKVSEPQKFNETPNMSTLNTDDPREFLLCELEKKNIDQFRARREFASQIRKGVDAIGFAGTKDKKAITCQRVSVFQPDLEQIEKFKHPDMYIKNLKWGKRKIKLGFLSANKFTITLRDIDKKQATKVANQIRKNNYFSNYFGKQRFGSVRGNNAKVGYLIIKKKFKEAIWAILTDTSNKEQDQTIEARKKLLIEKDISKALDYFPQFLRLERSILAYLHNNPEDYIGAIRRCEKKTFLMFLHSVQSKIFNEILDHALIEGVDFTIKGQQRIPLFGYKSKIDSGNLGEIEEDILKANKVELEDFRIPELTYLSLKGDYRTALVEVKNLDIEIKDDEVYEGTKKIIVKFDLPSGVYATTFLGNFFDLAEERSF